MALAEPRRTTQKGSQTEALRRRDSVPELSVLIATFNRAELLRACLDSFAAQSAPPADFEVVVVVDGSTDGTEEMLDRYRPPYALRVLTQENRGHSAALNAAVEAASGRFCLFTDDDVVASPELVAEHLRAQESEGGAVVVGKLELQLSRRGGLLTYLARWWEVHYAELGSGVRTPTFTSCYTGNLSAPLESVRRAGRFVSFERTHDIEFGFRLAAQGLRIVYAPAALATQRYTKGFGETVRDFELRGRVAPALVRQHPAMLPDLPLGAFAEPSLRIVAALRLLLAMHAPTWPLALVDPFLARVPRSEGIYRFLQMYRYWVGVRRSVPDKDSWRRLTGGVVILLYHAIGEPSEAPSRFVLPASAFSRQMAWLRRRRYTRLSLADYVLHRAEYRLPPRRSVVVTLDDGYSDNLTCAAPILQAEGVPGTIFLVSRAVGGRNHWDAETELAGRRLVTWDEIEKLQAAGTEVGAHTRTHRALPSLTTAEAKTEIEGSREDLERRLHVPVVHFAYPYGKRNRDLESLVEEAGFAAACGITPGRNTAATPVLALRRCDIDGRVSLLEFAVTVWLGRPVRFLPQWVRRLLP